MNNNYDENFEQNFTDALNLYETNFSHEEIIEMLKNGNVVQKQIAALKLDSIDNFNDAQVLLSNLTGQDGKIREAVSSKLAEFLTNKNYIKYFAPSNNAQVFLDAVIDINGNICRNIINALGNLKNSEDFSRIFCEKLTNLTLELLNIVEKFNFHNGKYKVNKEAFKLYWCLETIYCFGDKIDIKTLKEIIKRASNIGEYTIREKCAEILTRNFEDKDLLAIKQKLKNDSNYYVRRF